MGVPEYRDANANPPRDCYPMLSENPMIVSQAAMSMFLLENFDKFKSDGTLDELTQRPEGKPKWPQTLPSGGLPK